MHRTWLPPRSPLPLPAAPPSPTVAATPCHGAARTYRPTPPAASAPPERSDAQPGTPSPTATESSTARTASAATGAPALAAQTPRRPETPSATAGGAASSYSWASRPRQQHRDGCRTQHGERHPRVVTHPPHPPSQNPVGHDGGEDNEAKPHKEENLEGEAHAAGHPGAEMVDHASTDAAAPITLTAVAMLAPGEHP